MARPQRSTRDAWIDTFADWPADEQEVALDLAACVHRQTKRKAKPEGYRSCLGCAHHPHVGTCPTADRNGAVCNCEVRTNAKGNATRTNGQPAATLLDGQAESEAIR